MDKWGDDPNDPYDTWDDPPSMAMELGDYKRNQTRKNGGGRMNDGKSNVNLEVARKRTCAFFVWLGKKLRLEGTYFHPKHDCWRVITVGVS